MKEVGMDQRSDQRAELDARLLAEARSRASNARLKRVLFLVAAAFLLGVIGQQSGRPSDLTLGLAAAAVCIVVAVVIVIRGDSLRR